nr:MAG TPA_asm: hypothetical protein [Bacteriophage sp.]
MHFLGSQPRRLGIPLPLGCISPSSAGSLAFGRSYPVAGGRLFPSSVRQRSRGDDCPRRGRPLRWEQTAYHVARVAKIMRLHGCTRSPWSLVQVAASHYDNATHLHR